MGFLAILGAVLLSGAWLRHRLALPRSLEGHLLPVLASLAVLAPVLLAAASWSLPVAQGLLAAAAAVFLLGLRSGARAKEAESKADPPWTPFEWMCAGTVVMALAAALISALAPSTGWDAAVAHLALPSDYARLGRVAPQPGNVYAGYPHLGHTLLAIAHYPGLEKSTTLLNWTFALAACAAVCALGTRIASRRVGLTAMAILATTPIFVDQAGAVGIDLLFVAFTAAALCALAAWRDTRQPHWLALAAIMVGGSCGVRHTGMLTAALLLIAVPLLATEGRAQHTTRFAALAALAAAPWLLRAWWVTGNPVFPFLAEWFPSPGFPHVGISGIGAHETVGQTGGLGLFGLLRFPWDIVMRPSQYDGWSKSPGVLILALGVPGLFVGGHRARALGAFSGAGLVAFYAFQRFARYLLPFFVPMMVVATVAAERLQPLRRPVQILLLFTFAYGLALHAAAIHFKIPVTLGMQSRDEYLTQRIERYPAFQWANRHLYDGGVLLTVDQRSYYLDPPAYQNHWAMNALAGQSPEAQRAWLAAQGIRHLMIPAGFLGDFPALAPFAAVVDAWRRDTAHFERIETLHVPRRNGGMERVEFYRFRESPNVSSARPEAD